MKEYPNKVYLSTSWHQADKALSSFVVGLLMENGVTIVGDHPDYQKDDPFDRPWTSRVLKLVSDCSALIIVLPERNGKQTTSPYMFPEILAADAHGIPILLFHHQGVSVKKTSTNSGYNLHFGIERTDNSLTYEELFVEYSENKEIDSKLDVFTTLKLVNTSKVDGPYQIPKGGIDHKQVVFDFINFCVKRVAGSFVFNVLPFSLKDKEHVEISNAVFEETGLPCHIALDSIGKSQTMRIQWREVLSQSEFVIAEFSQLRDTCLYEAGVVMGMGKKIFLLAKKELQLPYGLDDAPLILYDTIEDLRRKVKNICCAEYKRKVYNFDENATALAGKDHRTGGIPNWYFDENKAINPVAKLTASSWIISISVALFTWSLFVAFGATDSPATFLGLALSFIFGIGSHLRVIRSYFESKYIDRVNYLIWGAIALLSFSIGSVAYVYYNAVSAGTAP